MKVYVVSHMLYSHSENRFQVHVSELNARLHYLSLVNKEKKRLEENKDSIRFYDEPEQDDNCYRTNCTDDVRVSIREVEIDKDFNPEKPSWSMTNCC